MSRFLQKSPTEGGVNLSAPTGQEDADLRENFPALYEFLTVTRWEDGGERQVATLLVFVEDGSWRVCLNDREQARTAWSAGQSLWVAVQELECGLASGTQSWRRSSPPGKKR